VGASENTDIDIFDYDPESLRRIAVRVLLSSLMSIERGGDGRVISNKKSAKDTAKILEWMQTPGFEEWCDLAGVNPEIVAKFGDKIFNGVIENNKDSHDKLKEFLMAVGE